MTEFAPYKKNSVSWSARRKWNEAELCTLKMEGQPQNFSLPGFSMGCGKGLNLTGTLTRQAIFMWRVSFETTLPMTFNIYVYPSKKWRSLFIFTCQKISKPPITPIEKYQWRSCTKMSQLWVTRPRHATLEVIQKRDSAEITLKKIHGKTESPDRIISGY